MYVFGVKSAIRLFERTARVASEFREERICFVNTQL